VAFYCFNDQPSPPRTARQPYGTVSYRRAKHGEEGLGRAQRSEHRPPLLLAPFRGASKDTLVHMKRLNQVPAANWDLALPNGDYSVRLVMGDPSFQDQTNHIKIEGVTYTDTDPYDDDQDVDAFGDFDEVTRTVTITDGKLTLSPSSGCYNTKLAFIEVTPLSGGGGSATPGLASATYKYDVLGRRVQKTVGSVTTTFVHAGDQVVAEYEGTSLKRRYI